MAAGAHKDSMWVAGIVVAWVAWQGRRGSAALPKAKARSCGYHGRLGGSRRRPSRPIAVCRSDVACVPLVHFASFFLLGAVD